MRLTDHCVVGLPPPFDKKGFPVKALLKAAAPIVAVLAVAACSANGSSTSPMPGGQQASAMARQQLSKSSVVPACGGSRIGQAQCDVLVHTGGASPNVPAGLGPPDLESAYKLPSSSMGSGQTVAVVDAYDDPNAVSDIAVYDSEYGLPAAKFTKYNQTGQTSNYPTPNSGWAVEESLDVDMMSAGCPNCTIYLVEANSNSWSDLETAVAEAKKLGATVISNSYSGSGATQSDYNIPGATVLASAGDSGYGIGDPADFPSVVAVGGTNLTKGTNSRGWNETAWSGTGSGCASSADAKPKWEKAKWTPGCSNRVANDVSAVAVGVVVYDTYEEGGFFEVDGTSISSPLVGSIFGLAGNSSSQTGGETFWKKKHHKDLYDITSGSNGSCSPSYLCTAGPGYDGPTGWGTPDGIGAF
jgi:hypothetical protein